MSVLFHSRPPAARENEMSSRPIEKAVLETIALPDSYSGHGGVGFQRLSVSETVVGSPSTFGRCNHRSGYTTASAVFGDYRSDTFPRRTNSFPTNGEFVRARHIRDEGRFREPNGHSGLRDCPSERPHTTVSAVLGVGRTPPAFGIDRTHPLHFVRCSASKEGVPRSGGESSLVPSLVSRFVSRLGEFSHDSRIERPKQRLQPPKPSLSGIGIAHHPSRSTETTDTPTPPCPLFRPGEEGGG